MSQKHPSHSIDCYNILIASAIIANAETGNVTTIELLDSMVVPEPMLGTPIPVIAFCRLKGHGKQVPTRFIWVDEGGKFYPVSRSSSEETLPSSPAQAGVVDVDGRAAMKINLPLLPPAPGEYKFMIEFWEPRGDGGGKWVRGSAYAPFLVQLMASPANKPS